MVSLALYFFIAYLDIVRQSIIATITNVFLFQTLLKVSNVFFLAFIPKKARSDSFVDFRPISLLKLSFKNITEILATLLASILPIIISPF